jgi:hypothetical protein
MPNLRRFLSDGSIAEYAKEVASSLLRRGVEPFPYLDEILSLLVRVGFTIQQIGTNGLFENGHQKTIFTFRKVPSHRIILSGQDSPVESTI